MQDLGDPLVTAVRTRREERRACIPRSPHVESTPSGACQPFLFLTSCSLTTRSLRECRKAGRSLGPLCCEARHTVFSAQRGCRGTVDRKGGCPTRTSGRHGRRPAGTRGRRHLLVHREAKFTVPRFCSCDQAAHVHPASPRKGRSSRPPSFAPSSTRQAPSTKRSIGLPSARSGDDALHARRKMLDAIGSRRARLARHETQCRKTRSSCLLPVTLRERYIPGRPPNGSTTTGRERRRRSAVERLDRSHRAPPAPAGIEGHADDESPSATGVRSRPEPHEL